MFRSLLVGTGLAAAAASAAAQAPAKTGGSTVEGVTVTAPAREGVRTSIDRQSCSIAGDLQASSGSIGDALRNVPSVEVDVQGDVRLRGDAGVTILVDGKPSSLFNGEGRAAALQSMSADQFERVEVITNPSAAFDPEGSAGIINLIPKKVRGAGRSGSVRAMAGQDGRGAARVSLGYNAPTLAVVGEAGWRRDRQDSTGTETRIGPRIDRRSDSANEGASVSQDLRLAVDWDQDRHTRWSLELKRSDMDTDLSARDLIRQSLSGAPANLTERVSDVDFAMDNTEFNGSWRRTFDTQDHKLTVEVFAQEMDRHNDRELTEVSLPIGAASRLQRNFGLQSHARGQLKAEYQRPIFDTGKLVAGLQVQDLGTDYNDLGVQGPDAGSLAVVASRTNRFRYELSTQAAYGTLERPFGDLTVLAGLRVEAYQTRAEQITQVRRGGVDEIDLFPSLHLAYRLDEDRTLTASYSRRIQRPAAQDLNPFRFNVDAFTYREGNARLRPQSTDSLEAGLQYRKGATSYQATIFARQVRDGVTDVVRDLGGGVLLTTKDNLGQSRSAGLELAANDRLTGTLAYSASTSLSWNEVDPGPLSPAGQRDKVSLGGRLSLNWTPTANDFLQVSGFYNPERLNAQGYMKSFYGVNLGYRRKLDERLSLTVTLQDALGTFGHGFVSDTATFRQETDRDFNFRAAWIGLTYAFGKAGPKQRDPGFEFGTPQ